MTIKPIKTERDYGRLLDVTQSPWWRRMSRSITGWTLPIRSKL